MTDILNHNNSKTDKDLHDRYLSTKKQLKLLELEKIDLIQALRLVLRSAVTLISRRGYNDDLADTLVRLESRLGSENNCQKLAEEAVEAISRLSGHDGSAPLNHDSENVFLKPSIKELVMKLEMFKGDSYREFSQDLMSMVETHASLESLLPVLVRLCLKIFTDYEQESVNVAKRLNAIIQALILTEQDYFQFLDKSIDYLDQGNRTFTLNVSDSLGDIQKTVSDIRDNNEPENLISLVSEKIGSLFRAVEKKKDEDHERMAALRKEKESLQARLDKVRREYDRFVNESRKNLKELEAVRSISLRDALTAVYNRRAYDEQIRTTLENFSRGDLSTFALVLYDIDNFREVNNIYGHQAGDGILRHIGRVSKETLRSDDFIFRYGGDEFIIILPQARLEDALKVAEKLLLQIEMLEFRLNKDSEKCIHVTISLGVTEARQGDTSTSILARADKALYESKSKGRNRVTSN